MRTHDAGAPFEAAAKSAVLQIQGRRVALTTIGNNRAFFSTLLGFAGLTPTDVDLTVVDDAKILQLARAGQVDFAMPGGAAENVVLMKEGFFRVFGIGQLLDHLPTGDPRAVTALGHPGLVGTANYIKANTETILRFMSVYYRIIDQVLRDPTKALPIVLPRLNAATGLDLTLHDCEIVFRRLLRPHLLRADRGPPVQQALPAAARQRLRAADRGRQEGRHLQAHRQRRARGRLRRHTALPDPRRPQEALREPQGVTSTRGAPGHGG